MNSTALVVGATGLVGKFLTSELHKKKIDVTVITRSPNKDFTSSIKIHQIDFDLFLKNEKLKTFDHIYLCLGTTIKKAGCKKEFKKVDYEYTLSFAKKAKQASIKKISLVSSIGADHNSKNF